MENTYNPLQSEKAAQEFWKTHDVYAVSNNPGTFFSIDTPPPTVSGSLHIGHVFSYTQADIVARYKRMNGFSVFYPFGFDDNGLPTERFVEKKTGLNALTVGRSAFIELCLKETALAEKSFEELWKSMGLSIDWSKSYSTISAQARRISQQSFIELYDKGFIYRKEEVAPYCTTCRTSVAQAELEDAQKHSFMNEVAFTSENGKAFYIATTRPELLASCVAVLYNPKDTRYQELKGKSLKTPLYNKLVPVFADERALIEKGTGLVMCSTFGDKTDVEWVKTFNLPYSPCLGRDGRMTAVSGFLEGKKVPEARTLIIERLKQEGLLRAQQPITHAVNVHERCKNEIEYFSMQQWFLKLLPYKETFLKLGEEVTWYPTHMKMRYFHWVENIQWDWCLSRQRFYGIPFPVWYCKQCGTMIFASKNELPVDPQETIPKNACTECGSKEFVPDTDVMDTWNTSSLTPYICKELYGKDGSFIPMSMRPQAHDIIRTWAFDTIVKVWMHDQTIPWKELMISGHVQTPQGEKISKSQGNSPLVPENLLKMYPADVIRYWTASAALGTDVAFSETQLKIGQRLLIKLWNAFRFIEQYAQNTDCTEYSLLDKWITKRCQDTLLEYQRSFDAYEFNLALEKVERFFWHDFCDNYLELIKDRLFNPQLYSASEVASTRSTLSRVGMRILQLFAPYMPHITETIYGQLFKNAYESISLHQTRFKAIPLLDVRLDQIAAIEPLLEVINQVRKLKSDHHLSLKTGLKVIHIHIQKEKLTIVRDLLLPLEQIIKGITRAEMIDYEATYEQSLEGALLQEKTDGFHVWVKLS